MKLHIVLPAVLTGALVLATMVVWLAVELRQDLDRVYEAEERRFDSIILADELRQSSDDLTKFARMFVQSGDERFVDYFERILSIRDGETPRPPGYEGIYWDRVIVEGESTSGSEGGEVLSIQQRMRRLEFSESEFALLAEAQARSDALTEIENRAFNAVRGRYEDDTGAFTVVGPPNVALAQDLLYGDDYLVAKAAIMEPIGQFQGSVNERTARALEDVRANARRLVRSTFATAGMLLGLLLALSALIYRRVLVRVKALAEAAGQITDGDLKVRSGVRGRDELGLLGTTFDGMVARLADDFAVVTAAKERMEQELNVAKDIQMSMLPLTFPLFPDRDQFSVYAVAIPAREVGGDFYDIFMINDDKICLCIGDVAGKGVPAALLMAETKTLVNSLAPLGFSTASITDRVNYHLSKDNESCMFVTIFVGLFDIPSGTLVYTNAGHNPPLLQRSNRSLARLDALHGPMVGIDGEIEYGEDRIQLGVGDTLLLYTDGVTEAETSDHGQYGMERLEQLCKDHAYGSVEEMICGLVDKVRQFAGEEEQFDDITALAFHYLGIPPPEPRTVYSFSIKNQLQEITAAMEQFRTFADANEVPPPVIHSVNTVFDELLNNTISYGFEDDAEHEIDISLDLYKDRLKIVIEDDGIPFDPFRHQTPNLERNLDEGEIGGLGIHIVRNLMTWTGYERKEGKNRVLMVQSLEQRFESQTEADSANQRRD